MTLSKSALLRQLLIYGLFLLVALVITFPLITVLSSQVIGGTTGDNYEMLRNIWWFKFALQTGKPLYYQTYMGYPDGFSSIALAANQLQFFPAYLLAFVMPLAMAYNLVILATMALNGWAMHWLARYLLGRDNEVPALITGLIFMCAPTFQGHLFEGHGGLMVMWAVPLLVWALFNLVRADQYIWRWTLACIVFFNLSPSGHMLQVIYVLMPIMGLFLVGLWWQQDWRGVRRVLWVGVLAGAFMLVFLAPMIMDTLKTTAYTEAGGVVRYSSDVLAVVSPSFKHPMWQWLSYPAQVLGVNIGEGVAYIGVLVAGLIVVGLWRKRQARWWLLLALVVWVLSLGSLLKIFDKPVQINLGDFQTYVPLPWALVQDVTGFSLARTPARFNFTLAFAVAMLAGYGASVLWEWGKRQHLSLRWQYAGVVLLAVGIVWDSQFFFPMPTRPAEIPQAVYDLRARNDVRAVFDVPWEHLLAAKDALYLQTAHEKPLIAGQITRQTPVDPAKLNVLENTLSPMLLRAQGADVVIFHKDRAREIDRYDTLQSQLSAWGAPLYEDDTIAIYNVPTTTTAPQAYIQVSNGGDYTSSYITDFYTPQIGWVDFNATLVADKRDVTLFINQKPLHHWTIEGATPISFPIPIEKGGFYRVELRLDEPCPANHPETLTCRAMSVKNPYLALTNNTLLRPLVPYANGVTLLAVSASTTATQLEVRLWWKFDQTISDTNVRFVHILDARGNRVEQDDEPLGDMNARTEWVETVRFPLEATLDGIYSIRAGWYSYPDLQRFAVLDEGLEGAQDGAPEVTTITIKP